MAPEVKHYYSDAEREKERESRAECKSQRNGSNCRVRRPNLVFRRLVSLTSLGILDTRIFIDRRERECAREMEGESMHVVTAAAIS